MGRGAYGGPSTIRRGARAQAERIRASVRAQLFEGRRVGRYVLERRVGQGGMGVVYLGRDPALERPVAVKLIAAKAARVGEYRERLVREARAVAALSHPNVVQVFDVGVADGQVYVAMEFVDGGTLRHWLRQRTRSWREIVAVHCDAARGLAAAHAAGLVHRDVKPQNILMGRDGRARLVDFGLVKTRASDDDDPTPEGAEPLDTPSIGPAAGVTPSGHLLGTPLYMAPEQMRGDAVGPAADQFALCVSLYDALFGEPPYPRDSPRAMLRAKLEGPPRPPRSGVPKAVTDAVRRGLRPRPEDRWPSVAGLVERLEAAQRATGRQRLHRWFAGAAVAVGVVAVLAGTGADDACDDGATRVSRAWSAPTGQALEDAFAGTNVPYRTSAAVLTRTRIDAYATALADAIDGACGDPERLRCLRGRVDALAALADVVTRADATTVARSAQLLGALPEVDECVRGSSRTVPPALQRGLVVARTLRAAGEYVRARDAAERLVIELGDADARLTAAAFIELGSAQQQLAEYEAARESFEAAAWAAEASGEPDLVVSTALELVHLFADDLETFDEAERWADRASAAVAAAASPRVTAHYHAALGSLRLAEGRLDEAEQHLSDALDGFADADEPLARVAVLAGLGQVAQAAGDYPTAARWYEEAIALEETVVGPEHPRLVSGLSNLGNALLLQGKTESALEQYHRAEAIATGSDIAQAPTAAGVLVNIGNAYQELQQWDRAEASYRAALVQLERVFPPSHPKVCLVLTNLGRVLSSTGDVEGASRIYRDALERLEAGLGKQHPLTLSVLNNLAVTEQKLGDHATARARFDDALQRTRAALGESHPQVGIVLLGAAENELDAGDAPRARALAEASIDVLAASAATEAFVEEAREVLARATG